MTASVILFATAPRAALAWEDTTLAGRIAAQFRALGAGPIQVVARPEGAQAVAASLGPGITLHESPNATGDLRFVAREARADRSGDLALAHADVVTQDEALAGVLLEPGGGSGVLISRKLADKPRVVPVRAESSRVVGAASVYHRLEQSNAVALGVLRVGARDRPALASAADELAGHLGEPDWAGAGRDVVALLLVGLVRGGTVVTGAQLRGMSWARPKTPEGVARSQRQMDRRDSDRALLTASVKRNDGFFTTFFVAPYSPYVARWFARRGWSPNQVTVLSMAVGAAAAAAFATGDRAGLIAGALLLQAAFTLDCVDGQLARYTRTFSVFGAWLDGMLDRAKEYLVYAGLAIGAGDVWALAAGALAIQTARHALDLSIPLVRERKRSRAAGLPLATRVDPGRSPAVMGATSPWGWIKKIAGFPIGERFAAISICAAVSGAELTFAVILVWTTVGIVYLFSGMARG